MTLTPAPSVTVTSTLVFAVKQNSKASGPVVKAPIASVVPSVLVNGPPPGVYVRVIVTSLLGVKPVPEILPAAWSRVMSAVEGIGVVDVEVVLVDVEVVLVEVLVVLLVVVLVEVVVLVWHLPLVSQRCLLRWRRRSRFETQRVRAFAKSHAARGSLGHVADAHTVIS